MRTIVIHPLQSEREKKVDLSAEQDAVAYLVNWASPHFLDNHKPDRVDLYPSLGMTPDDYEIIAVYKREGAEKPWFVMGAIYRPDQKKFSFHS